MIKRSLTQSGSQIDSTKTSYSSQQFNPLITSGKMSSQESNGIYNILQEQKVNNSKNIRIQSNPSSLNQITSPSLIQNKSGNVNSASPQSSRAYFQSNSQTSNIFKILQSNSTIAKKQFESQQQSNQRSTISTQKTTSLHNANDIQSNLLSGNNSFIRSSKSSINHSFRTQTQTTPTQQKTNSSVQYGKGRISPKLLLTGDNKNTSSFHSHRGSLASSNGMYSNKENINSHNNPNYNKIQNTKKNNIEKSTSLQQQSSLQNNNENYKSNQNIYRNNNRIDSNNILKENNNIKNAHNNIINYITQQNKIPQQTLYQQKQKNPISSYLNFHQKQQPFSQNLKISSCTNLDSSSNSNNQSNTNNSNFNLTSGNNITINNQTSNSKMAKEKDDNLFMSENDKQTNQITTKLNSERSYFVASRAPKSSQVVQAQNTNVSNQSKNNLQSFLNTTNQTQNTDVDIQHYTSIDSNNQMNISSLSANTNTIISTNNLTERNISQPDQMNIKSNKQEIECIQQETPLQSIFQSKCSNHPDKKAKYIICNSQQSNNLYCSKCAVQFSQYGFQIIHISDLNNHQLSTEQEQIQEQYYATQMNDIQYPQQSNQVTPIIIPSTENETQIKLQEIQLFLDQLNFYGNQWQELNRALLIKKNDVNNFYERQLNRIENQYQGFIDMIKDIKEKTIYKLNENRDMSIQIYQNLEKETKENLTDYLNIKADIEMNTEKIVNLIQMDDFQRIMDSYKERFTNMAEYFLNISNERIDLLKFNNQVPSFNQFKQQLEQSFNIVNFNTTLIKKRVSEQVLQNRNQNQLYNNSMSILLSTQSNFSNDQNLSPHNLTSDQNTDGMNWNQQNIIKREKLNSQNQTNNFCSNMNQQFEEQSQIFIQKNSKINPEINPHMNNINRVEIVDKQLISQFNQLQYQQPHSNYQSSNNSPVKYENNQKHDNCKKDIYVSFGNNKEASLHKAIQQVKNNQLNPQISHFSDIMNQQNYLDQHPSAISQNTSAQFNQIKPLSDIMEQNMNDEDEGKSQPNTPQLKQIDDILLQQTPSSEYTTKNYTNNESQKPFRNLFVGENENQNLKSPSINQFNHCIEIDNHEQQNKINQCIKSNDKKSPSALKSPNQINNDAVSDNFIKFPTFKQNDHQQNLNLNQLNSDINQNNSKKYTVQTTNNKSPRYSLYEAENNYEEDGNQYNYQMKNNRNQLDDYAQMIEQQNTQINNEDKILECPKQFINENSFSQQSKHYYFPNQTSKNQQFGIKNNLQYKNQKITESNNSQRRVNQGEEVIVIHDNQEEFENPLLQSPNYKQ